jgi:undecaprenyl diphosphate synthase
MDIIPRHLAIIMDGNGRWAQQRHMPRIVGHQRGVEAVRKTVEKCCRLGIKHLTLYAFSSENWGRPADEVSALMGLLTKYLTSELKTLLSKRIRLNVIGETEKLPDSIRQTLEETMERTRDNDSMTLTLALSYGARDEILRACRNLAQQVADGDLAPEQIDEELFSSTLDTGSMPDPDLLIRTSGEMRISNFLLWQMAYTELYFSDVYWPDFNDKELEKALAEFSRRQRRFGLTSEQMQDNLPSTKGAGH